MFEDQVVQYQRAIKFMRSCIDLYHKQDAVDLDLMVQMYDVLVVATTGKYRAWLKKHFTPDEVEFFVAMAAQENSPERAMASVMRFKRAKAMMHLPVTDKKVQALAREYMQPIINYGDNMHIRKKMWGLMLAGDIPHGLIPGYEKEIVVFINKAIAVLYKGNKQNGS